MLFGFNEGVFNSVPAGFKHGAGLAKDMSGPGNLTAPVNSSTSNVAASKTLNERVENEDMLASLVLTNLIVPVVSSGVKNPEVHPTQPPVRTAGPMAPSSVTEPGQVIAWAKEEEPLFSFAVAASTSADICTILGALRTSNGTNLSLGYGTWWHTVPLLSNHVMSGAREKGFPTTWGRRLDP